jgi:hypothetical protein
MESGAAGDITIVRHNRSDRRCGRCGATGSTAPTALIENRVDWRRTERSDAHRKFYINLVQHRLELRCAVLQSKMRKIG